MALEQQVWALRTRAFLSALEKSHRRRHVAKNGFRAKPNFLSAKVRERTRDCIRAISRLLGGGCLSSATRPLGLARCHRRAPQPTAATSLARISSAGLTVSRAVAIQLRRLARRPTVYSPSRPLAACSMRAQRMTSDMCSRLTLAFRRGPEPRAGG